MTMITLFQYATRILVCIALLLGLTTCTPPAGDPLDAMAVQQGMQALITYLDSPSYAAKVSWPEHIVLAYRAAQGRDPSVAEFALVQGLRQHPGLKRSDLLGLALAGDTSGATWQKCADLLAKKNNNDFVSNGEVTLLARRLFATPRDQIAAELEDKDEPEEATETAEVKGTQVPGETYGTYFGFLHAHSGLSLDAQGAPLDAYTQARDSGMDFFSLSDHAEFLILWPWDHKWQQVKDAADATDEPGRFTALWGFEWSNPILGHASVIGTNDFTHSLKTFRVRAFYNWLAARPEGFAQFNHPGDYDFLGVEFLHFRPYPRVAAQMVGLENWNEDRGLDYYYYSGSWDSDLSYLDVGNQKGWRLGALGAQDNHRGEWGSRNEFRTGVLATELSREGITEALRARRFYATEDKDLVLDFRCGGYPMGATVHGGSPVFLVNANDGSGDTFTQVRLFRNGIQLDSKTLEGNPATASFTPELADGTGYYYVIVTQADDNDANGRNDEALSSPIWIEP